MVATMDTLNNPFVKRRLDRLYAVEREIIRLYAETCYTNIQAAYGNLSCMERLQQLGEALDAAGQRLRVLKRGLRRLGVPPLAMISLDDLERLSLFEADFKRHDAAFAVQHERFGRQQLYTMLNDIAGGDSSD
jgi:hypothetical protein